MKNLYRLLSLLSLSALAAAPLVRADEPPAPPPPALPAANGDHPRMDPAKRREHRLQELNEKLSLTPDQQAQIKAIWDKAEQQGKALRAQGDELRAQGADLRAKGAEVMKATHAQVRAVLTPEQQKIFDAMPPPGRGHHGPHHGDGAGPGTTGGKPADAPPGGS